MLKGVLHVASMGSMSSHFILRTEQSTRGLHIKHESDELLVMWSATIWTYTHRFYMARSRSVSPWQMASIEADMYKVVWYISLQPKSASQVRRTYTTTILRHGVRSSLSNCYICLLSCKEIAQGVSCNAYRCPRLSPSCPWGDLSSLLRGVVICRSDLLFVCVVNASVFKIARVQFRCMPSCPVPNQHEIEYMQEDAGTHLSDHVCWNTFVGEL